jgi:hypothetical integral membrane protein (TIGR02206 family)
LEPEGQPKYFQANRQSQMENSFSTFGLEHCTWLVITAVTTWWLIRQARRRDDFGKQRIAQVLAWIPPIAYVLPTIVIAPLKNYDLNLIVPLHLCYFLALLTPLVLVKRRTAFFQVTYFWVMAGCSQSLLTPDMADGFPHPFSFRYWLVHISLVQCWIFAIFAFRMRPQLKHILWSILWFDVYLLIVGLLNYPLGTNFLYLRHKPPVPTMMDYLGEFPWFLFTGQFLMLAMFLLVYTPFLWRDWQVARQQRSIS